MGLTSVEGQGAAGVTEGRTVREIALTLGHTEGTVRWHLHQIYHKQGLSGQVALVRRALAVAVLACPSGEAFPSYFIGNRKNPMISSRNKVSRAGYFPTIS